MNSSLARAPRRLRRRPRSFHVRMEALEARTVLSAFVAAPAMGPAVSSPSPGSAVSPQTLLSAYDFNASTTAGKGTTIAIIDAYDDPTLPADLKAFDAYYGLPAASLSIVNENGQTTNLPAANSGWSMEESLDVEWAHVAAPGAKIVLVESSSDSNLSDMLTAIQTAAKMGNVVSMSWGNQEFQGETAYDSPAYLGNPNVTFVASSGDDGGAYGVNWPAASPDVLSVGGTTLAANGTETAWNASGSWWTGYSGSNGGVSWYEPLPSFQATALGANAAYGRVVPDVASDANPASGVAVYTTAPGLGATGWFTVGGTSAGAPVWAGLIADADAARLAVGKPVMSSSQTLAGLYSLYGTPSYPSSAYATAFHDITSGYNFAGDAGPGYDVVTGLGSPVASNIIARAALYNPSPAAVPAAAPALGNSGGSAFAWVSGAVQSAPPAASVANGSGATVANAWISTLPVAVATATTPTAVHVAATPAVAAVAIPAAAPTQSLAAPTAWTAPATDAPSIPATIDVASHADAHEEPAPAAPAAPEPIAPALDRLMEDAPVAPDVDETAAWDEAMAQIDLSRPAPIEPAGAPVVEEAGGAPRLAVALGLAAVALREARRRGDARRIVASIPTRS